MKSFLRSLFGDGKLFSVLERRIMDCVREKLDSDGALKWDAQVSAINKVQRLPGRVEVNFYRMTNGKPTFDNRIAFANRQEELLLASCTATLPDLHQQLNVKIWCVKGFVFSMEFEGNTKYFEEALGMSPVPQFKLTCNLEAHVTQVSV